MTYRLHRPLRGARAAAVIGISALALAACSGGDDAVGASSETSSTTAAPAPEGDGTLAIGSLLPQTGTAANLGPPTFAGAQLALNDIAMAGGYNGTDVVYQASDSGDPTTDIAAQSVERLLAADVDVILGAAASDVSLDVIDTITGAGVVQISPANTSPTLTTYDDGGLYFRTTPSDVLQGRVMAELLLDDGYLDVALLTLDDPYGSGLAESITSAFEEGDGEIVEEIVFDPDAPTYDMEVSTLVVAQPEALVVIGFAQTIRIVEALQAQGVGPDTLPLYFVDANLLDYSEDFVAGTLAGVKGTLPGNNLSVDFQQRLRSLDPALSTFQYAGESYDAVVLTVLAATAAGSDSGEAIASQLQAVSRDGEKCTSYAGCLELLEAGEDIDYDGVSGPVEFDEHGNPTAASIGIYQYGDDNTYSPLAFVTGTL